MVASLDKLSNTQLCAVYNAVTGEAVSRFTNVAVGLNRVRRALEADGVTEVRALELAGLRKPTTNGVDGDKPTVDSVTESNVSAPAPDKVEGVDYVVTTDKWGYKHRESLAKPESKRKVREAAGGGSPVPRSGKLEAVLALLRRHGGVTVHEIASAMGWLPHTTRAYLSRGGAAGKAVTIMTERVERGGKKITVYSARSA